MMESKIKRLVWLDIMKGVAIFLVALRHVFIGMHMMDHPVSLWIHLFHMPFFFLLSGFLAVKSLDTSVWKNYKKKAQSLMIPFFTCGLSLSFLLSQLDDCIFTLMHNGYWFLVSLFTCWLIFLPIAKGLLKLKWGGQNLVIEAILLFVPFFVAIW